MKMKRECDIVFINPGDRKQVYQELGDDYSAIEPPYPMAALAGYVREKGFNVEVIDANAENLNSSAVAQLVKIIDPALVLVVVGGSQPSASTQNMTSAGKICKAIKSTSQAKIAMAGLHPSALPEKTLMEESIDFVIQGEGYHTICMLLNCLSIKELDYFEVDGLWYIEDKECKHLNSVPLLDLNKHRLKPAWDLFPMEKYRAHNWHCFDSLENRGHYGVIYTSFGCPFSCEFCAINSIFGKPGIRYRNPKEVVDEITGLVRDYGVKNLKIADELFILNDTHYMGIVNGLIKRKLGLNIWAYARVDTIKPEHLKRMKRAGINWLGLGIETANKDIQDSVNKRMKKVDVHNIVKQIQDAGIGVGANYMFGLPDDTMETMQETFDLAVELNCELANFYCCMAYPGSTLFDGAVKNKCYLPANWSGYSQHSYETLPLATKHLTAKEVLKFRDEAFHKYYESERYLSMVEKKFGIAVSQHIQDMTKIRLKRKLISEEF